MVQHRIMWNIWTSKNSEETKSNQELENSRINTTSKNSKNTKMSRIWEFQYYAALEKGRHRKTRKGKKMSRIWELKNYAAPASETNTNCTKRHESLIVWNVKYLNIYKHGRNVFNWSALLSANHVWSNDKKDHDNCYNSQVSRQFSLVSCPPSKPIDF